MGCVTCVVLRSSLCVLFCLSHNVSVCCSLLVACLLVVVVFVSRSLVVVCCLLC